MNYKLHYKFNTPDARDHIFKTPPIKTKLENSLVLTIPCGVLDQGTLGSCVSNATAVSINKNLSGACMPSRLFIYFCCRNIDGSDSKQDTGTSVRSVCSAIKTYGITAETNWAYNITKFTILPTLSAFTNQQKINSFSYKFLVSDSNLLPNICIAISLGTPVIFGMNVYSSFMTSSVAKTGIVPIPNKSIEKLAGGHCMAIIGYDNIKKNIICQNSWGIGWGDSGKCYLPYALVQNISLCSDFTILTIT